jgi:TatD DNase family protein
MKLFDTHAHLLDAQFDHDRNEIIPALPEHGVAGFLEACTEAGDIPKITALVMLYDHVFGSAGIHPHSADSATDANLLIVERALKQPKILAVGEIGLDYHYDFRQGKYSARPLPRSWIWPLPRRSPSSSTTARRTVT